MSETIAYMVNVSVANGPRLSVNRTIDVDAFDKFAVPVADGATDFEVELQPGVAGKVKFLAVLADEYGDDLSYTVDAETTVYSLDEPHILTGAGAVSMLDAPPEKLLISNALGHDTTVQILIGREATT